MPGIDVVISGIGQSEVGRKLPQSGLDLTVDASPEAIADAGLTPADIDGMATFPGRRPDAMPFSFSARGAMARNPSGSASRI